MRTAILGGVLAALAAPLLAQTTLRSMQLLAPAVLGQTATFGMTHPVSAAGNPYAFLWGMPPFVGTLPLSVPGFTVSGVLRVDPTTAVASFSGVLGAAGSVAHSLAIPSHPSFLGLAWDLQSIDLEPGTATLALADDELAIVIGRAPAAGLDMVWIPAGSFVMGSTESPSMPPYFNQVEAQPVHLVTLSRPFWIGRCEVTQAQYRAVMGTNPSSFQEPFYPSSASRPVEQVTWNQAVAYCAALTAIEQAAGPGYQYRLPTEAEWEYCCRAGSSMEFHYGPTLVCGQSNVLYSEHSNSYCSNGVTTQVGRYLPNALGLYDMHGNVWEWCLDRWDGTANYSPWPVVDPYVQSGTGNIVRGGSADACASASRAAFRRWVHPGYAAFSCGFRVVCAPILP